jgi:ribosomal protein L24E
MGTMSVGKDAITQYLAKSKAESATAVSYQPLVHVGSPLALQ